MRIIITKVTTVAECNEAIASANELISEYNFRKTSVERQFNNVEDTSTSFPRELARINRLIDSLTTTLAGIPPGAEHDDCQSQIDEQIEKRTNLEERADVYGIQAYLSKGFKADEYEARIALITQYRDAYEARKAALEAGNAA